MHTCKILLKEELSENLSLRDRAEEFFDQINSLSCEKIELNFSDIKSISNSFAQEYIKQKNQSKKTISEKNVPQNVNKMFKVVVSEPKKKYPIIDLRKIKVTCL